MLNPIRFSGLSLNSDELAAGNGALAVCAGLELKDGFIRPSVLAGTEIGELAVGTTAATLLYVHNTGSYTHYLAYYTESSTVKLIYFYVEAEVLKYATTTDSSGATVPAPLSLSFDVSKLKDIDSVGNTLVLLDEDGLVHYVLWRNGAYEELPQKPPMLDILFRLGPDQAAEYPTTGVSNTFSGNTWGGYRSIDAEFKDVIENVEEGDIYRVKLDSNHSLQITDDYATMVQNTVYALMNTCNAVVTKAGHFYAPFMVRYCYRMFDGSFFMHSAPIYLPTILNPLAPVSIANFSLSKVDGNEYAYVIFGYLYDGPNRDEEVTCKGITFHYQPINSALQYQILNNSYIPDLDKWKDVIKSVDIFITPPQTTLTTDREISSMTGHYNSEISQLVGGERKNYDKPWRKCDDFETCFNFISFNIPSLSSEEYFEQVCNCSTYFRLKSIDLEEIAERAASTSGKWTDLDVDSDVVRNIEVQKQLTDDYKSHNLLRASGSYIYNHRINLWGVKEKLFEGFSALTMATWLDASYSGVTKQYRVTEVRVKVHSENGDFIVSCPTQEDGLDLVDNLHFIDLTLFYPDTRATKMWIIFDTGSDTQQYFSELDMTESEGLNGAFAIGNRLFATDEYKLTDTTCPVSSDLWLDMPSKVYTGAMDNPYYFPLAGINTVGTGTIIGLASTTRALSQGQFGQYPLMAFTTDGIWALEVSSSGTYSSIHPISREVATSADGICQLDQAVIFVSSRGANIVQESQVTPLSDMLVGVNTVINASSFKEMFEDLSNQFGAVEALSLSKLIAITESPIKFLQHAQAVNDSNNHRVLFIDTDNTGIALVLNMDTLTWSYMSVPKKLVAIAGYPYTYISYPATTTSITTSVNKLICLDTQYDYLATDRYLGMLLTRALTFSGLYSAIAGFRQSHGIILSDDESLRPHIYFYGSNDLRSWHYIGHTVADRSTYMPAHSFRYFRVGLLLSMRTSEQYLQVTLDITDKYNRL